MKYKLFEHIITLSNSKKWETAKNEWIYEYSINSQIPMTCPCGHFPILEVCIIKNTQNENETYTGNCCIKKFMPELESTKIHKSIIKTKKDISKSFHISLIKKCHENRLISQSEFEFYENIIKKRKLSVKQKAWKISINNKILNWLHEKSKKVI